MLGNADRITIYTITTYETREGIVRVLLGDCVLCETDVYLPGGPIELPIELFLGYRSESLCPCNEPRVIELSNRWKTALYDTPNVLATLEGRMLAGVEVNSVMHQED